MSHPLLRFFKSLVWPRIAEKPKDLQAFDAAQKSLYSSSRALSREASAFGELVMSMSGGRADRDCGGKCDVKKSKPPRAKSRSAAKGKTRK